MIVKQFLTGQHQWPTTTIMPLSVILSSSREASKEAKVVVFLKRKNVQMHDNFIHSDRIRVIFGGCGGRTKFN